MRFSAMVRTLCLGLACTLGFSVAAYAQAPGYFGRESAIPASFGFPLESRDSNTASRALGEVFETSKLFYEAHYAEKELVVNVYGGRRSITIDVGPASRTTVEEGNGFTTTITDNWPATGLAFDTPVLEADVTAYWGRWVADAAVVTTVGGERNRFFDFPFLGFREDSLTGGSNGFCPSGFQRCETTGGANTIADASFDYRELNVSVGRATIPGLFVRGGIHYASITMDAMRSGPYSQQVKAENGAIWPTLDVTTTADFSDEYSQTLTYKGPFFGVTYVLPIAGGDWGLAATGFATADFLHTDLNRSTANGFFTNVVATDNTTANRFELPDGPAEFDAAPGIDGFSLGWEAGAGLSGGTPIGGLRYSLGAGYRSASLADGDLETTQLYFRASAGFNF